jgi:hypothetical protein
MRKSGFLLLLVIPFILVSCEDPNRPAHGPEDEIIVVADSDEFAALKSTLDSTFEKIIFTPQPEKLFNLKRVSLNNIENYQTYKNIIFIAPQNSSSKTSRFVDALIDTEKILKSASTQNSFYQEYNLWAKDQLVVILTAPDIKQIENKIIQNKDHLLSAFRNISDKRLYESLYDSKYEKRNTEGMLLKNYGWIIYVQPDFKVTINHPKENFICFKNTSSKDMGKWIFVYWIDNASPAYLNDDTIWAIRNRLTDEHYRIPGDTSCIKIAYNNCIYNEVTFNGKYALLSQGLWESSNKMEGPFVNYTFFDEKTRRVYMLDGSIYAPQYYKRNLIQQMDVILQSFKTKAELSKDKQDELLEAAD